MQLSKEFKQKVLTAILADFDNYGGTKTDYARRLGIHQTVFSRLLKGETEKVLSDSKWLLIANDLGVKVREDNWKVARTEIYTEVEDNLTFCQEYSKAMILVDDCGIGKTFCSRHIVRQKKNAFYIDCSQAKTKQLFIRLLAKTIGVDSTGRYADVKNTLKTYLAYLEKPLIVLDEAGDLDYTAFLELKELWNATQGHCGWYMIGADGLRAKIRRGIQNQKVGYAEIFDRFFDIISLVPQSPKDKEIFYRQLIGDVASANLKDKSVVGKYIKKCMDDEKRLRYLETLIKMSV
ncbi:AAA family ATPase [Ornithobacterium rhinotracheale]